MSFTQRMAGKVALITGGAGGIGAAVGGLFREHGAKVLLVDQAIGDVAAQAGIEVVAADVTKPADAERAVAFALEKFGTLNVLVNNAAVRNIDSVADANLEEWRKVLETNVLGAVNFSKAALPPLRAAGKASIVNVSSCYAVRSRKGFAAYDASKAALLALTRTLAAEEAEHGIRVNAVCPGGTLTPFTIGRARARGRTEADLRRERKSDALLGRWAEPLEIAYPILWLASDEASYVTGATLMVDGG
jgi:meso-butanediol dehydrogenase/(S,S)-butanediol dehydrogenase/diacetyl reductase